MEDYRSPIEIINDELQLKFENDVVSACMNIGINVDKDELLRALRYDRHQFDKGYKSGFKDGYQKALDVLVDYRNEN